MRDGICNVQDGWRGAERQWRVPLAERDRQQRSKKRCYAFNPRWGKVEAGPQSSPLCELELELKRGESAELFKLARMLAEEVPVQLAVKSKAERGYALIAGKVPGAVKAAPVALTPDCSRQAAFQTIARACLRQLVANAPVTLRGDPEGLHQMRVALRHLRAAISLFADMLLGPQTEEMKAQFKWITGPSART
jgi:triphosphatase